jgi:hypothetical protein
MAQSTHLIWFHIGPYVQTMVVSAALTYVAIRRWRRRGTPAQELRGASRADAYSPSVRSGVRSSGSSSSISFVKMRSERL